jgi:hypothetical protein
MTRPARPHLAAILMLLGAVGCAPTTLAPMMVRMSPGDPSRFSGSVGLHTGPRLSVPLSVNDGGPVAFPGDANSFSVPQWSLAYDFTLARAITPATSIHFGAQGEFFYPFPLPAYGLHGGLSHLWRLGSFCIGPALTARGATDLGLPTLGGPGTLLGAELSATLAWRPEERVGIGLVPFLSVQRVWVRSVRRDALYVGAALVGHLETDVDTYELTGGFGRVYMSDVGSWNSPIIGARFGR